MAGVTDRIQMSALRHYPACHVLHSRWVVQSFPSTSLLNDSCVTVIKDVLHNSFVYNFDFLYLYFFVWTQAACPVVSLCHGGVPFRKTPTLFFGPQHFYGPRSAPPSEEFHDLILSPARRIQGLAIFCLWSMDNGDLYGKWLIGSFFLRLLKE